MEGRQLEVLMEMAIGEVKGWGNPLITSADVADVMYDLSLPDPAESLEAGQLRWNELDRYVRERHGTVADSEPILRRYLVTRTKTIKVWARNGKAALDLAASRRRGWTVMGDLVEWTGP